MWGPSAGRRCQWLPRSNGNIGFRPEVVWGEVASVFCPKMNQSMFVKQSHLHKTEDWTNSTEHSEVLLLLCYWSNNKVFLLYSFVTCCSRPCVLIYSTSLTAQVRGGSVCWPRCVYLYLCCVRASLTCCFVVCIPSLRPLFAACHLNFDLLVVIWHLMLWKSSLAAG